MTQWYQIRALADRPRAAEISIYGDIGESWFGETVTARQFVQDLAALDADEITIRINSYGGSVTDGIAIYNAIRRKPGQKTVCIDGVAASIASLIAMAGDRVEMADNAMMMIHAPWGIAAGNAAELRDMADVLDKYAQAMASSYVAKSGKSHEEVMALLTDGQDHWYSATEAQSEGFADAVTESLPIAASVFRAALTARFKSLPQPRRETAAAAAQHEEQSMSENQGTGVAADPQKPAVDIEAIRAETLRAEAKRRAEILALKSKPAFAAYADGAFVGKDC
jgi:ATP-dependent Clp endopeptidase proteolytic subunit ClpP